MANLVQCPSCQSRLSLGDDFQGRRVRCPRCKQVMEVGGAAEELPVAAVAPPPRRRAEPSPQRHVAPPVEAPPIEPDYSEPERSRRRRKRRSRRSYERETSGGKPAWIWLVFGAGAVIALLMIAGTFWLAVALDIVFDLVVIAIGLAFMMPISAVILFISMMISSSISGGIDFSPLGWCLLKAAIMLVFVNLCYMIPLPYIPYLLALGVWFIGWTCLFKLDIWEAWLLIIINWILMTIIKLFLLGILVSLVRSGKIDEDFVDPKGKIDRVAAQKVKEEQKAEDEAESYLRGLGVTFQYIEEGDDAGSVRAALCHESRIEDEDLAKFKHFKKINTIVLSGRPITDKGLKHLQGVKTLVLVGLENTKVTDKGVAELRKALPRATINHRQPGAD